MVNKENIQKWVDALRSGKYPQTKNKLKGPDGYCALGVACRVAIDNGVPIEERVEIPNGITHFGGTTYSQGYLASLPGLVIHWLGTNGDPLLMLDDGILAETSMCNDELGLDFKQIAHLIENTYLREK